MSGSRASDGGEPAPQPAMRLVFRPPPPAAAAAAAAEAGDDDAPPPSDRREGRGSRRRRASGSGRRATSQQPPMRRESQTGEPRERDSSRRGSHDRWRPPTHGTHADPSALRSCPVAAAVGRGRAQAASPRAAAAAKGRSRSAAGVGMRAGHDDVMPSPTVQREQRRRRAHPVVVNLSCCKYPLLRDIAARQGWAEDLEEGNGDGARFNLWWTDTSVSYQRVMKLRNWQRINHFPSMHLICRKNALSATLGRLRRFRRESGATLPGEQFFPRTWSLKSERNLLRTQTISGRTYIVKPSAGCQGKGIFLTHHPWRECKPLEDAVVQEYVDAPLLIESKKFDLRVYVLVTSVRHLSIHVFSEGLVRLCTEDYIRPSADNIDRMCMHLTNYAINRQSENFVFNTDAEKGDTGNKRDFAFFRNWLEQQGHDPDILWRRMDQVIVQTLLAAQPQLHHEYNSCFPHGNDGFTCFEVLGFDLLIDERLRPWLLEVNHSPSFRTDTPLDLRTKSALIEETVRILNLRGEDRYHDARRAHDDFLSRTHSPQPQRTGCWNDPPSPKLSADIRREPGQRLGVELAGEKAGVLRWGRVEYVEPGSEAAAAGVEPGWRCVRAGGELLTGEDELRAALRAADQRRHAVTVVFEQPPDDTRRPSQRTARMDAATQERLRRHFDAEDRRAAAAPSADLSFRRVYPAFADASLQQGYEQWCEASHEAAHLAGHVAATAASQSRRDARRGDAADEPAAPAAAAPPAADVSEGHAHPAGKPRAEPSQRSRSRPPLPQRSRPRRHDDLLRDEKPAPRSPDDAAAPSTPSRARNVTVVLRCPDRLGVGLRGGGGDDWRQVASVAAGGIADRAGVLPGMRLLSAGGARVASEEHFRGALAQARALRSAEVPFVFSFADPEPAEEGSVTRITGLRGTSLASIRSRLEAYSGGGELVSVTPSAPMPLVLRPTPPPVLMRRPVGTLSSP